MRDAQLNSDEESSARPPSAAIQVLVVDDFPAIRDALSRAIQKQSDMRLVGAAGTCQEAMALTCKLKPDVLVLDLNLPDGNGWNLLEQLSARHALPKTLVFSGYAEEFYALRLLRAGARGYLMKGEPLRRVLEAIREVHAGHIIASMPLTSQLMARALGTEAPESRTNIAGGIAQLSDRELQVFALLGQGMRNKEAANRLNLSEKTVATYKVRVMEKLGLQTLAELIQQFQSWQGAEPNTNPPK